MEQQTIKIRKLVRENRLNCPKNENVRASFKKIAISEAVFAKSDTFPPSHLIETEAQVLKRSR
jgi:hypothetical protein